MERLVEKLTSTLSLGSESSRQVKVQQSIAEVLEDLWHHIVYRVVQAIDASYPRRKSSRKTRIWWIPTSSLWKLPLHAAGVYKKGGQKLMDRFISSYTPTLSLLIRSFEARTIPPPSRRLLLVTVPSATKEQILQSLDEEAKRIKSHIGQANITHLADRGALRRWVLLSMLDHPWIHFACHGLQHDTEPFKSSFELWGKPLRLVDIIKEEIPCAEFAFLAACHTAAGDMHTPDESIHLAAGMQFVGYRSVVGTMWAMADSDGPTLVNAFYEHMTRNSRFDCRDAAEALSKAITKLRKGGVPLERWINFVHYGA
jgi:CHAT domain-containing protein